MKKIAAEVKLSRNLVVSSRLADVDAGAVPCHCVQEPVAVRRCLGVPDTAAAVPLFGALDDARMFASPAVSQAGLNGNTAIRIPMAGIAQ